jgi:hypothetical protein
MKPQVQSRIGKNGRCLNACLASILEIPEHSVPDFPDGDGYFQAIDTFLKPFGVRYEQRPITEAPPKNWHTIEGVSPRGGMHAVCGYNGKFKFDPHPVEDDPRRGLVKPERWGCLVPISEEVKPVGDVTLSKKAMGYEKWLVTLECTSGKTGIKKGTIRRWIMSAGSPEQAMKLVVKNQVYPEFWRAIKAAPYDGGTVGDSVLRPGDIKRGPGPFTVQLTEKDGREHTEPVSALRTYDSVDPKREARIRALGKIEPHQYQTPKPGSASLPCKQCGLSVWAAEHKVKAADGLLSNTAMLLAALYAWYRSRMDEPAQQPRNYDLTTYTPRQRAFDTFQVTAIGMRKVAEAERRAFHLMAENSRQEAELLRREGNTDRAKKFLEQELKWLAMTHKSDKELYEAYKARQ